MGRSRSAKEICAEDPGGISCSVAKNREKRQAARDKEYGDPPPKTETKPKETKDAAPKAATERGKYIDAEVEKQGG